MDYVTHYQSANKSMQDIKRNFVVRISEFERVLADIKETDRDSSFQHYVFVGRRGSGKSTLLRRIQAEINLEAALSKRYIAINLSEEQSGIYKLHDLWDYVIRHLISLGEVIDEIDFRTFEGDIKGYTVALHQQVIEWLRESDKQLILLVDNIDRIFKNIGGQSALFREQLMNYNDIRIIGGSTIMSEEFWKYDMPFYEFFAIYRLESLTIEEVKMLLTHWSKVKKLPDIAHFLEKHPGKIQAIRMLTDGTPRTMLLFIDLLVDRKLQNGYEYLQKIIDQVTPIYQERLGQLSPAQKKVLTELSFFWEASTVDQLINKCKMDGKTISAILNQLSKFRYVKKIKGATKNLMYRLEERFFNLWLLMTQGGPEQRKEARYLTIFLENWYDKGELKKVYSEFKQSIQSVQLSPDYASVMTRAIAKSSYITSEERDSLITEVKSMLASEPEPIYHLPRATGEIYSEAQIFFDEGKYEKAVEAIHKIDQDVAHKYYGIALCYEKLGQKRKAVDNYSKAAIKGHADAMNNLATLYKDLDRTEEAEEYYKQAIEKGHVAANSNLAILCKKLGRIEEAEEYYEKAIEKGHTSSLNSLAILNKELGRIEEAEGYYKRAIEKGNVDAIFNLGILNKELGKVEEAEENYKQAIEKGHIGALNNLGHLLEESGDDKQARKYYKMAIEKGNVRAMNNLGGLYQKSGEIDRAIKSHFKAYRAGDESALHTIGGLYIDLGEEEDLKKILRKEITVGSTNAILWYIGLLYEEDSKKEVEQEELLQRIKEVSKELLGQKGHQLVGLFYLWLGEMVAFDQMNQTILSETDDQSVEDFFLVHLLIHGQKQLVTKYFNLVTGLRERYRPLYYAMLMLNNASDPQLLKMPPELNENVEDILEYISQRQEFYYPKLK